MIDLWHVIIILGLALITLITRAFFLFSQKPWLLPARVQRGLQFAPIAALSAVVFPKIFVQSAQVVSLWSDARFYATLGGCLFYVYKKGQGQVVLGTIMVGMLIYLPLHIGLGWS